MCSRGSRTQYDKSGRRNIILAKNFHSIHKLRKFGRDPGLAFGLLDSEAVGGERLDPDGPKCLEVGGLHDENYIIYIG